MDRLASFVFVVAVFVIYGNCGGEFCHMHSSLDVKREK